MPVRRIQFSMVAAVMVIMAFVLPRLGPEPAGIQAAAKALVTVTPPVVQAAEPDPTALPIAAVETPVAEAGANLSAPVAVTALPALEEFAASLNTGSAAAAAGVYVPDLLAMRIVDQPQGEFNFIDPAVDTVTRYGIAEDAGAVGLLAHNYSGGAAFASLSVGQSVYLIDGAGRASEYIIEQVQRYQAVTPSDPFSHYIDLADGQPLNSSEVFAENFLPGKLVFQTCIEQGGEWSWGRLFVIAAPVA